MVTNVIHNAETVKTMSASSQMEIASETVRTVGTPEHAIRPVYTPDVETVQGTTAHV